MKKILEIISVFVFAFCLHAEASAASVTPPAPTAQSAAGQPAEDRIPTAETIRKLQNQDFDILYSDYYDCDKSHFVRYVSKSGEYCTVDYYIYTPKNSVLSKSTPVIAYVSHGGGTDADEKALATDCAANLDTPAIFVIPNSDRPEAVCRCIEDARRVLDGKGNFDAVSIHGTSSGGRAVIMAAEESTDSEMGYGFRFANIIAYDPAQQHGFTITGNTEALRSLAEYGTVLFIQTDKDVNNHYGGSGKLCNDYAKAYSEAGGTAIVAEIFGSNDHERKFIKPLTHNSLNWSIGTGPLVEDDYYRNSWYYYEDAQKIPSTLEEVTAILHPGKSTVDTVPKP